MIAVGQGEMPEPPEPPELPATLPVLPLRDTVTYPDTLTPLAVGQPRSITLINDVLAADRRLVMVASKDPDAEEPGPDQLHQIGVAGVVARMLKVPDGTLRVLVQGAQRVRIEEWTSTDPYLAARVTELPDVVDELDRALLTDRERRPRVGKDDHVLQRQDRQPGRQLGHA